MAEERVDDGVLPHRAPLRLEQQIEGDVGRVREKELQLELEQRDAALGRELPLARGGEERRHLAPCLLKG